MIIITRVLIDDGIVIFKAKENGKGDEFDHYLFSTERLKTDDDYSFWNRHLGEKYWYTKRVEADFFNLYMSLGEK